MAEVVGGGAAERAPRRASHLLPRVGHKVDLGAHLLAHQVGDVADARGLRDLVEDLDLGARLGRVVHRELDALARVGDMDERARLAAGAVHGQRDPARRLHQEAVQHGAVLAVVVEAVAQPLVARGEQRVGAPDDTLQTYAKPASGAANQDL